VSRVRQSRVVIVDCRDTKWLCARRAKPKHMERRVSSLPSVLLASRLGFVGLLVWVPCLCETTAEPEGSLSVSALEQMVNKAIDDGNFDISLVHAIHKLPARDQARVAAKLLDSRDVGMRRQGMLMLEKLPAHLLADRFRKVSKSENLDNRNYAALYLAEHTNDADARALLLANASDKNPAIAAPSVAVLGRLRGEDVDDLLLRLLKSEETAQSVRLAAITAAGEAHAKPCTAALVRLLEQTELRSAGSSENVRICDMAAAALERMYRINYTGAKDVYWNGPIEKRDEGIVLWQKWWAGQAKHAENGDRGSYVDNLFEESVKALAGLQNDERRVEIKSRLKAGIGCSFCLGDFPGVTAVVAPSVRDALRIMRASGEDSWQVRLNPWQRLEEVYKSGFVPKAKSLSVPDEQAWQFIAFAEEVSVFPKIWVWSFCRDFKQQFPNSPLLSKANEVANQLNAEFGRQRKQIVLHGHIAVLEPMPQDQPNQDNSSTESMVSLDSNLISSRLAHEPSNWGLHQVAVDFCRRNNLPMDIYPFLDQSELYPGNEWPYLGAAIFELRHKKRPKLAIEFSEKALILNPENAKAYAIRGMIRVVSGESLGAALDDLVKAFSLDKDALGGEPETLQAAIFIVERFLADGNKDRAKTYCDALGPLKRFGSDEALRQTREYQALGGKLQ